jgi:hypothetical protein
MGTPPESLAVYALSLYPVALTICSIVKNLWYWLECNELYNPVTRTYKAWLERNVEWATCAYDSASKQALKSPSKNLAEYALSLYPVVLTICSVIGHEWVSKDCNRLYNSVTRTCKAWRERNVEWATCAHYRVRCQSQRWINDLKLHAKFLRRVYALTLQSCHGICDVSALCHVHTVSLRVCADVRDVSTLGGVHTLNLYGCTGVRDVSSLGHVHNLDLSWCTGVCDVSALGRVYNLNLCGCTGVRDVSALGHVHRLNLCGCTGVRDVSALGRVHELCLELCTNVRDVSALGFVHTLYLCGCTGVADTSMLVGVYNLTLPNGDRKFR